ncbi:UDP-N-acetylglucosamine transporter [Tolypocladium ophioglossoides CBS 100239]|uniref:UDP-N-acetylglucosamine transporter n=1 Tax=Tolypocladium ophioglossoides (strain CBS 100239) TaxID=1163406 RepID=A0A0L0NEQ9_TOLOC|nr:UDP-N-acetylglucosamine transporter [Tolypocladium ophioglossoides CBS 100239]
MAILEPTGRRDGGAARGGSFGRNLSFITLTFQNSALILVMHYSRMMPPSGDHRYFTSTAVFLNEVIKLAVALTLAIYETSKTLAPSTPATTLFEQIYNAVFADDGWKLALPAAFYTLQNLLQYTALGELDPVHFQVLYQVKILTTAIFSVALLRRQLGVKRWISLIVLTLGVCVVSLPSSATAVDSLLLHGIPDHYFPRSKHELGQAASADLSIPDSHLTKRSATYEGIANDLPPPDPLMNYSVGVTAAVVAAVVSGLAGVYFEKLLKESPSQASVWFRNIQLSFYSLIFAFFGGVVWQDGSGIREHGFFEGYNWIVWAAIVLQAAGGLIASLVIRDTDNIVKNFATSISIVISFVVSMWMFEFTVTMTFLIGTSLVLLATYLYSVPERSLHRPPPVRIASFEKSTVVPLTPTPGATPRMADLTRLNSDAFEVRGLAMTTSRPSSPLLPRQMSRTHVHRED